MTRRTETLFLSAALAATVSGCLGGDAASRMAANLPPFCQEVLPRVEAFLAGFAHPEGPRFGGSAIVGTIGEMPSGMNALVSTDYTSSQHQTFVHLMTLVRLDENFEPAPTSRSPGNRRGSRNAHLPPA